MISRNRETQPSINSTETGKEKKNGASLTRGAVALTLALATVSGAAACGNSSESAGARATTKVSAEATPTAAVEPNGAGVMAPNPNAAGPTPAAAETTSPPISSSIPLLDLNADGSWKIACVLSPAEVNSILAPAGITVDSDQPGSYTDGADCEYSSTDSAGASDFQLLAYGPTHTYGYLTSGTTLWTAPNPAQGYRNVCNAAQANGGAQCIPDIGRGLIVGDSHNQAVLFVDGPAFYVLNILYFDGRIAAADTYVALAKSVAAAGPVK